MFGNVPKMTTEDLANIALGFLPDPKHLLTITSTNVWYAKIKDKREKDSYMPLVAWAYLKNGDMLPLVYQHDNKCHFIAFAVEGFMGIVHEDGLPDDDDEDDVEKYKR